jgi:hypothetical protein
MKENRAHYFIFTVSLRILRDLSKGMGTAGFNATRKKVKFYIMQKKTVGDSLLFVLEVFIKEIRYGERKSAY